MYDYGSLLVVYQVLYSSLRLENTHTNPIESCHQLTVNEPSMSEMREVDMKPPFFHDGALNLAQLSFDLP